MNYYTITEAAQKLGIHERNVRALIREGQLKTVDIGGKMKIDEDSILNIIPGFRDDPNPDVQPKKQFHQNIRNDVAHEFDDRRRTFINQNPSSY